jgi:hypothetical protein
MMDVEPSAGLLLTEEGQNAAPSEMPQMAVEGSPSKAKGKKKVASAKVKVADVEPSARLPPIEEEGQIVPSETLPQMTGKGSKWKGKDKELPEPLVTRTKAKRDSEPPESSMPIAVEGEAADAKKGQKRPAESMKEKGALNEVLPAPKHARKRN